MAEQLMVRTVYHRRDGAQQLFTIDARHALLAHPEEWSDKPWPEDQQWSEADHDQFVKDKEEEAMKAKGRRRSELRSNEAGRPSDDADQDKLKKREQREKLFDKGGKP
jgi:hypothetical protein